MDKLMLKHEENAFIRELHEILEQKCHEFKSRTGHRVDLIDINYQPHPEKSPLTFGVENKDLFECYVDIG